MSTPSIAFDKFRDDMLTAGYEEVLERSWLPGAEVPIHTHAFEANALVVQGEMWLTEQRGTARRREAGDRFHLKANIPHEERYGPQGAIYWVARQGADRARPTVDCTDNRDSRVALRPRSDSLSRRRTQQLKTSTI